MRRGNPWIVIGAGASGLAAAYFLRQRGLDSVIIERDSSPGGRIGTVRLGNRLLDSGGKNIGRNYALFREFAKSLGTYPFEHFGLNSSQVVHGKLVTFDASARWRTMLGLMNGVSARDVMRFGRMLWEVKRLEENGYLGSRYASDLSSRFDDAPANHYFSPVFSRRIIRPMSVRMNGAEPGEIFLGNMGSNLRMITDTYEQFRNGLEPLLNDASKQYDIRLNTTCESFVVKRGRLDGVRVRYAGGACDIMQGAGVILATPATVSAQLIRPVQPRIADLLHSIAYYPVALIVAEYAKPVFLPSVRAITFDEDQPLSNAGAYGLNDLNVVRYTFSGRTAREHISASKDPASLLQSGEELLAKHLEFDPATRRSFVSRTFDPGLCAYTAHHPDFLTLLQRETENFPGLYLTGDYLQGASIEACFRSARSCVSHLETANEYYLQPQDEPLEAASTSL